MKNLYVLLVCLIPYISCFSQGAVHEVILIKNIKLIDGTASPIQEATSVLVENGRFKIISKTIDVSKYRDVKVLDGKGKSMIPGIVGVHNHLHVPGNTFLGETATKLYLASGVTTIQTCGAADAHKELKLAEDILHNKTVGPEIVPSAPYFTGVGGNPSMIIAEDESQLRDTVRFWAEKGAKWFKVYRNTRLEDLKVILDEAHKYDARVTGHLCSITFREAATLGIDAIEHGFNSVSDFRTGKEEDVCSGSRSYIDELDLTSDEVNDLLDFIISKGVVMTSTLSIYEASIPSRTFTDERSLMIMTEDYRKPFEVNRQMAGAKESSIRENRLKRIMEFEYLFYHKGGTLSAGVDAGRHILPGFGDQRNFELLLEAGFTTTEAVNIMTDNGAKKLDRSDIGTIQVGKRADFVILKGDLEKSPRIIRNVEKVYKAGVEYDSKSILRTLEGKFGE